MEHRTCTASIVGSDGGWRLLFPEETKSQDIKAEEKAEPREPIRCEIGPSVSHPFSAFFCLEQIFGRQLGNAKPQRVV
jgi:hypothetical protein